MNKDYIQNASLRHQTAWQIKGEILFTLAKLTFVMGED
jgi:hypothetical protein